MEASRSCRCPPNSWRISVPEETAQMRNTLLCIALALWLVRCTQEAPPPPPVPPAPEDLSTWSVPDLVQAPVHRPLPTMPKPVERKPTPAEKVYDFVIGGTYQVPVMMGFPLDVLLEPGEEI